MLSAGFEEIEKGDVPVSEPHEVSELMLSINREIIEGLFHEQAISQ